MGWLQEAIRNAFKQRQEADSAKVGEQLAVEKKQRETEANRLSEIRKKKDELWKQLASTGVEKLLEDVKNKVWHDGKIRHYAVYNGEYFPDVYDENKIDQIIGWEICLEHGHKQEQFPYHPYQVDGFLGVSIQNGVFSIRTDNPTMDHPWGLDEKRKIPVHDENAIDKIKDYLRRDCETRILNHWLPKDRKK